MLFKLGIRNGLTRLSWCWLLLPVLLAGCAGREVQIEPRLSAVRDMPPADADEKAALVRRDPRGYLEQVAARASQLDDYTLKFTRYERRGLFNQMHGPENILTWFRREPFSVRMKWLNEDLKYYESTYVAGQEDDKVRFVTRWPTPLLKPPPGVNKVDLQTPVRFGESKRPLTDFGLERMMERTLASVAKAGDDVVITYEGLKTLEETGDTVHHLHLAYSPAEYRVPHQDLYIDAQTDLPVGTVLKHASGKLDAAYFYENVDPAVDLTDEDFLLTAEREERAAGTKAAADAKSGSAQ